MDDFNKESAQHPYLKPEESDAGDKSFSTGAGTAARMKLSEKAADIKDRVADFGRKTVDKIDDSRETAAGALDATASTLHSRGDQLSGAAHSAANKISATAEYVRQTNLKGMAEDVQDILKRYPTQTLVAAAVLGFLVARAFRGND
jgi:ElaB/YqjD/DUF883 family membrane-anchored ribosome-binding protein